MHAKVSTYAYKNICTVIIHQDISPMPLLCMMACLYLYSHIYIIPIYMCLGSPCIIADTASHVSYTTCDVRGLRLHHAVMVLHHTVGTLHGAGQLTRHLQRQATDTGQLTLQQLQQMSWKTCFHLLNFSLKIQYLMLSLSDSQKSVSAEIHKPVTKTV